jgi:hypothetical protein
MKLSKFNQYFSEPVNFSGDYSNTYCLSAHLYNVEEAAKIFREYFNKEINIDDIEPARVRFGFGADEEGIIINAWWIGGGGNQFVWTYDI